jgi:ankyrin repeat protein
LERALEQMISSAIISRALAFSSTLLLSIAILNIMPGARARRQTHFARAAADGNVRSMRLLQMTGARVNSQGGCCAPLLLAAVEGRLDAVRYLLDQGADVNARDERGRNALTEAAFNGNAAVIKELILRGAELNALSDEGTALDIATKTKHEDAVELLKHYGAKSANNVR